MTAPILLSVFSCVSSEGPFHENSSSVGTTRTAYPFRSILTGSLADVVLPIKTAFPGTACWLFAAKATAGLVEPSSSKY